MELNLLEEVFGSTEATNDKDILVLLLAKQRKEGVGDDLKRHTCRILFWAWMAMI